VLSRRCCARGEIAAKWWTRFRRDKQKLADSHIESTVTPGEEPLQYLQEDAGEEPVLREVFDIYGFRVIVGTPPPAISRWARCTSFTSRFRQVQGLRRHPKGNGYQSLHTTLFGPFGTPIEVQIRTLEMHKIAERAGSHWLYKDDAQINELHMKPISGCKACWRCSRKAVTRSSFSSTSRWTCSGRGLRVYPKGKIMALPHGATAWILPTRCTRTSATAAWRQDQPRLVPLRTETESATA